MKRLKCKKPKYSAGVLRIRDDIAHERRLSWGFGQSSIPGTHTAEILHDHLPFPVAIIWYRWTQWGTAIEILYSFVPAAYRRCGLRSLLNKRLFDHFPTLQRIVTDCGTVDGGEQFLKASGYRVLPGARGWELKRRKKWR